LEINFDKKTCGNCERFSARKLLKEFLNKDQKKTNIGRRTAKVAHNWFDRMYCRKQEAVGFLCLLYVVFHKNDTSKDFKQTSANLN